MDSKYKIGQIIKNYKVIGYVHDKGRLKYECMCVRCGNIVKIYSSNFSKNRGFGCKNCFTDGFIRNDLIGKKFGCYTVIAIGGRKAYRNEQLYICKCDCGNESCLTKSQITQKKHKCCIKCRGNYLEKNNGCYRHGETKIPLYNIWTGMISRCYKKYNTRYHCYGGRGIKVCDEWQGEYGYEHFRDWALANGYKEEILPNGRNKWTLDRIDVNSDYCPQNCRFATQKEQMNNTQKTIKITYNGETHSLKEWTDKLNIPYERTKARIHSGYSFSDAIKDCNYHDNRHTLFGEKKTIKELSQAIGCSTSVVSRNIKKGIPLEDLYKRWKDKTNV